MNKKKIFVNIFSNWTNLCVSIAVAFIISPIMVHRLGNELYGIWTLIVSITSYFTILDFGVSTAVVRFISKYSALNNNDKSREIYSNAFIFFGIVAAIAVIFSGIFAIFFPVLFDISSVPRKYACIVFLIVGCDLAINILFSLHTGCLRALHEFYRLNIISVCTIIIKNAVLVYLLIQGNSLMTVAVVQLATTIIRNLLFYSLIKIRYSHLRFYKPDCNKKVFKTIFSYSVYSFIISIALKVLFFTDSVVIGSIISVSAVTFYSIPMTLVLYVEKLIYSAMSVMTPIISSNEAKGEQLANQNIYIIGTKYSLSLSLPILFVLYNKGGDFISIWMGAEYGVKCYAVLQILVLGYVFALPQVVANSILKGISKHKLFSFFLTGEALVNLGLSIILGKIYGIIGVALGTTIPLVITNLFIVPFYTCSALGLSYTTYLYRSIIPLLLFTVVLWIISGFIVFQVSTYFDLALYSTGVLGIFLVFCMLFVVEKEHRQKILYPARL